MSSPQHMLKLPCCATMKEACTGVVVLPRDDGLVATAMFSSEDRVRKFRAANVDLLLSGLSIKFDLNH